MVKIKKKYMLFLMPVLILFLVMPFNSCNPHRKGSVIKGKNANFKRHNKPAASNRKRR